MAISKIQKQKIVNKLKDIITSNQFLVFVDFSNIKTNNLLKFKKDLKSLDANYLVVKKNLLIIVLKQLNIDSSWLENYLGSIGIIYSKSLDKEIEITKLVFAFIKDNLTKVKDKDSLKVVKGLISQEFWELEKIIQLSKIPSIFVLKSQLVNVISSPLSSFENVLYQIIIKFLLTLKEVEKIK